MEFKNYKLKDCLEKIIDNRGRNPKYFSKEIYPVIDNYLIKNTMYPDLNQVNRFIDENTYNSFLRGYTEKDMPIMTLVGNGIGNITRIPKGNVAIVQNTIGFKTNDKLDKIYLYYWVLNNQITLKNLNRGTGQPSIKKTDIENLDISLPKKEIQKKIVKVLNIIDEKIEENNQTNNNLLEMIGRIFKEWFVNYEFLNEDGKPYKSSGGKMVDSVIGEIPSEWKFDLLGNYITIKNGCAFKGKDFVDKGIPVIKIKNIKPNKVLLNELSYVSEELASEKKKYKLNENDVVITMTGNRIDGTPDSWVGKAALFNKEKTYLLNQRLAVILGDNNYLNQYFLNTMLSSWNYQLYFIQRATSSGGQANISPTLINNIEFLLPNKIIMDKFKKIAEPIYKTIEENENENDNLEQLRDTLLPKLMNGEIDLENIDL